MTIKDTVDWVIKHRSNKVFKDWTSNQIAFCIGEAIADGALSYSLDKSGKLEGICTGKPQPEHKTLRVTHLLTTKPGAIPKILMWYHFRFEGWKICCKRKGKEVTYENTPRLVRLLERLT